LTFLISNNVGPKKLHYLPGNTCIASIERAIPTGLFCRPDVRVFSTMYNNNGTLGKRERYDQIVEDIRFIVCKMQVVLYWLGTTLNKVIKINTSSFSVSNLGTQFERD